MVPIGEVADVLSGFAFPSELFSDDEGEPLVRIRDVARGYTETRYRGAYSDQFVVNNGDVLIGMDGNFTAARWKGGRALLNQRVCKITADPACLDLQYLFHFLPSVLKRIEDRTPFVTVKHLSAKELKGELLPLPALPEQRRIAAILDQADALRAKRREALAQLDSLTQSIFFQTCNERTYPQVALQDLCELITDGTHQTPTYADEGIVFLSAKNVTSGTIDWESVKFIPRSLHVELHKRVAPQLNDILLAKNGTTGVAAIVDRDCVFDIYVSLALLRPTAAVLPQFLLSAINSPVTVRQFKGALKGIGVPNLHLKDIRSTCVPCPPPEVQQKFVDRMQSVAAMKTRLVRSHGHLNALFASLQFRAFSGEL